MTDPHPPAHRDPDRLSTLCDTVAEAWRELSALPRPVPEASRPRVEQLLSDLAQLHDVQMLELWEGDLPAPAQSLNLFDVDDDGDEEVLVLCTNGSLLCFQQEEGRSSEKVTRLVAPKMLCMKGWSARNMLSEEKAD